jgi:thiamine-phosphate pyrophosphorylase
MMKLVLISHPDFFYGEEQIVSDLLKRFNITFHLRKPEASIETYRAFLENIPDTLHHQIMLHGAYDLSAEFNLKGLHFSTRNRELAAMYPSDIKSTSCHSVAESKQMNQAFDYHFLSPVFPSISKEGYRGNLDLNDVKLYLRQSPKNKILALGGIDKDKIPLLKAMGFDGVAVMGAIWAKNPADEDAIMQKLLEIQDVISVHL